MDLSRARQRYLLAVATILSPAALVDCTREAAAEAEPMEERTAPHFPSCPQGAFCDVEPAARPAADAAAPAPYAACAVTMKGPPEASVVTFDTDGTGAARAKTPNACCYTWMKMCGGGRVLRDAAGRPTVAPLRATTEWLRAIDPTLALGLSAKACAVEADFWAREAASEHASIASFAQLTLDLLAVGAPPDLLESTQRAALDEIEHARITFALASAYGHRAVGPAPLAVVPARAGGLTALAVSTFLDGCIGEAVASAALAERARSANHPALAALLQTMADDEERHAELAFRIVAWTLRASAAEGAAVATELRGALADALDALRNPSDRTTGAPTGIRAAVLREVIIPCARVLLEELDS